MRIQEEPDGLSVRRLAEVVLKPKATVSGVVDVC